MVREVKPTSELIDARFEDNQFAFELFSVNKPKAIIIAGVSGSGKSTLIREFYKIAQNYFPIQADDYRRLHPKINQFIEKYGREEVHKKTGNFSHRMATALLNKSCESKFNVVYETTFNKLETANNLISVFQLYSYEIFIIALPIDTDLSIERNKQRFKDKLNLDGTLPRIVEKSVIERMAVNYEICLTEIAKTNIPIYRVNHFKDALAKLAEITALE